MAQSDLTDQQLGQLSALIGAFYTAQTMLNEHVSKSLAHGIPLGTLASPLARNLQFGDVRWRIVFRLHASYERMEISVSCSEIGSRTLTALMAIVAADQGDLQPGDFRSWTGGFTGDIAAVRPELVTLMRAG